MDRTSDMELAQHCVDEAIELMGKSEPTDPWADATRNQSKAHRISLAADYCTVAMAIFKRWE